MEPENITGIPSALDHLVKDLADILRHVIRTDIAERTDGTVTESIATQVGQLQDYLRPYPRRKLLQAEQLPDQGRIPANHLLKRDGLSLHLQAFHPGDDTIQIPLPVGIGIGNILFFPIHIDFLIYL